ncbi:MAG TPA: LppX_LprAFG lipoprotein [Nocardioidaceae bacterium]|nr:LppX_LprAFG lipoprotein [Nocardioidaceae bacterium]
MMPSRSALAVCAVTASLALSGCTGGDEGGGRTPEETLAAAKATLDETSGVRLELETEKLPPGVDGILSAVGVGTHAPAFEGDLRVSAGGIAVDVPVVAAESKVFAQLPFTTEFVEVDPADYAAPDPADLMGTESGLSSLLTAAEGVEEGKQVRSGEDVLSSFTATVPGDVVAGIIPSASAGSDFDATFTVDDEDRLREAVLTGPFYPDTGEVTYTIAFDEYDTSADIALP